MHEKSFQRFKRSEDIKYILISTADLGDKVFADTANNYFPINSYHLRYFYFIFFEANVF